MTVCPSMEIRLQSPRKLAHKKMQRTHMGSWARCVSLVTLFTRYEEDMSKVNVKYCSWQTVSCSVLAQLVMPTPLPVLPNM